MRLSSGIVLVTLISLLSVFVGVKSDGKSFPYTPAAVANLCSKDSIHVMLLIDTSAGPTTAAFQNMIAHANDLASGLLTTYTAVVANPVVMSVHYFSATLSTATGLSPSLATVKNAIGTVTFSGGVRNTGAAISAAVAYSNSASNVYPRRVIYVLTSGLPADSTSTTGNVYNTHKNVEATGIEVFVELYGAPVQETFPGQIVGLASAPNVTHFVNSTGTLTSTVQRVVSSIRRDLGGSCTVLNNNNIITYDGVGYTPSASGYNVLTQTLFAPLDQSTRTFSVIANGNDISITSNADTIRFVWSNGEVSTTLNNNEITLAPGPNNAGSTQINVALSQLSSGSTLGITINVTTTNRDVVQIGFFDTPYVVITPFADLFGHVVGLCGTWDNCNNNEFVGSNGVVNTNAQQSNFVSSWNVPSYTYNTALYATFASYTAKAGTEAPPTTVADNAGYNAHCNGIRGNLLKFCNYDASSTPSAAAVYHSLQASTCEQYCQSGIITSSVLLATDCDSFCTQNYPPLDLFNISNTPPAVFTTRQNVKGLQKYINVYIGGRYVIKATDSEGIVDYTTLEFNCSEELVNITAGDDVTVTRSPSLGFPQVQLLGVAPQNYVNRAFQLSWKAVSFPYVGQDDNTTTPAEIAAQAPVIISGTSISPRFTPSMPGQYIFTLAVYDGCMVRYHNVTVNAVCDNCLFTSRVEPVPTVFWRRGQFPYSQYNSYIYAAPQYISPANEWSIPNIQPYNLRSENLTVTSGSAVDIGGYMHIPYKISLTTGTRQSVYNSSTIPTQTSAGLVSTDDASPYRATPITLTVGLVVEPTPAIISKAHHHRWDYSVVTKTVNVVGVPQDDFNYRPVCLVDLYYTQTFSLATWAPQVAGVADYCTGKYSVELFADDFCHNSTDVFINQVECNSRPILNAPGCRDDILLVYNPNAAGTTGWIPAGPLDGTNPYDTEEITFTYNWTLVSSPALSRTTVTCTTQTCNVQPDFAGDYVVKYTVNDGCRTESATYTLHAVCYQERYITQNVTNTNPEFNGNLVTVQFISNSTVAKPSYLRQFTTIVSIPTELSNLPPFGAWGQRVNPQTGSFVPTAKGTWNVDFSAVDECGVLNVTTVPVYYTCLGITGTPSAVISADRYETETSGAFYPAIFLDGTASSITSTSYTPVGNYYWYYRPTGSNSVAAWVAFGNNAAKPSFSAPSAGQWDILLIYSDNCEYASTTITVTANCLPPILVFEIDGTLIDEFGNSSKIVDTIFPWYDPSTYVTLNGTQSQNYSAATVQWIITFAPGDVYTYTTYSIGNAKSILTNLQLNYPTGLSGNPVQPFTVALSAASACGVTATTPAVTLATTCAAKYNGYLNIVTVTADKSSVNFLSSNRFDSSTITAEITYDPLTLGGEPHYKRFLVTQAPASSIYAPQVRTTTTNVLNTVNTIGPLNNTGFNGQYNIATTTTTTTVTNTWVWIELETDSTNHSYYACFTPDLPGTYVITTELRDICNNTRVFTNTITAGCPAAITFSSTPNITIDTNNFRDLARVSIDASSVQNPAGSDLKFRWTLSNTNGTYDQTFNGTYFDDETNSLLTNFYGSVVSFVLPYTDIANTYSARYDIWDGCQTISGYVNISIPAIGHRNIFQNSVPAYNPNNTAAIKVDSLDSIAISQKQYIATVAQDLRQTDCYAADIEYEVVGFQSYVQPPAPAPKKKGTSKGVIIGAVVGSVAGAALIGAAIFGIMKYKARSVAV